MRRDAGLCERPINAFGYLLGVTGRLWVSSVQFVRCERRLMPVHSTRTELTCNKSTQLHDTFIDHARQSQHLIGCSETRTVCAESVGALQTLELESVYSELQFAHSSFYPRDAMLARELAMALCLSVSVTSRCSIETGERIGLVFGAGASFHMSLHCVKRKFGYLQK